MGPLQMRLENASDYASQENILLLGDRFSLKPPPLNIIS
jgi:hypothetical protein